MPFPFDKYPWINFHELNLAYFIVHFREIFEQWDQLYHDLMSWKDATDADLAEWKSTVEAGIASWETGLAQSMEDWKDQTETDISGWEAATLAALDAWKTATTAVFEQIRTEAAASATAAAGSATDAQTALAGAQTAQAAAEAAAVGIQSELAQIETNTADIADLQTEIEKTTITETFNYTTISPSHFAISPSGTWTFAETQNSFTFPITERVLKIKVTGHNANGSIIAFLSAYNPVYQDPVSFSSEYPARISLEAGEAREFTVKSDMLYMFALLTTTAEQDRSPTVEIFSNDTMRGYKTLPNNTDLDTVKWESHYTLQSGNTYPNKPVKQSIGATLITFKNSSNIITQLVITIEKQPSVYVRSSVGGVFNLPWSKISNDILESSGDDSDRTNDIQSRINAFGYCKLGAGKFVVTGVNVFRIDNGIDLGAELSGCGIATELILAPSITDGHAIKIGTYSAVKNMQIKGGDNPPDLITNPGVIGTRNGIIFESTIRVSTDTGKKEFKSIINNCFIHNFDGSGIRCYRTGPNLRSNLLISDCHIHDCRAGINIEQSSEFHRISTCAITDCYYGCVDNGGNNNFINCDFSGNRIGILIDNTDNKSPNNSHGTFSACSINHSYQDNGVINGGTAIKILNAKSGEIFEGLQVFYNKIVVDNSVGIRFIGINCGQSVPIEITNSCVVTFSDSTFRTAADSPVTLSGNVVLLPGGESTIHFDRCYLRDGTPFNPVT